MGFIDSYKRLEKLCGEILNDERRVSAYIDEMINTPRGEYLVSGWNDDLKQLKHYRWMRNQIVHNPDCSEENMCNYYDTQWINDFYSRIMNQTDPLALYRKATQLRLLPAKKKTEGQRYQERSEWEDTSHRTTQSRNGCGEALLIIVVIVAAVAIWWLINRL